MIQFFFTYALFSLNDHKFYIGWTDNLNHRLKAHNSGLVLATKYRQPFKLVYYEVCLNKNDAIKREKVLKSGFGRKYLKNRLTNYFIDTSPQKLSL